MKKVRLKSASPKYAKALDLYHRSTKPLWLEAHPFCQFEFEGFHGATCSETFGCTVHHKMGRGKYLNDMQYFMTVCRPHHAYIETYKKEARKLGYILYK